MTIELRPLNTLDPDEVNAALQETVQRLAEDNPQLEIRRGVFAELLAYYHAVLDTQRRANIKDYLNGRSLLVIENDPTLADPTLVDDILSNFRLERKPGRFATGEVTVIVSDDVTITIAEGSVWEARGKRYVTPSVFVAKAEAAQVTTDSDRLFVPTVDGNYAFTITVNAEEEGSDFDVKKDTLVAPLVIPPNYLNSYAASDFTSGLAVETNQELLGRLQEGIAAKALSNRVNMAATLRTIDNFSRIVAMSIIGYGDAELARAQHSILPIALSGRCDWYIRTQEATTAVNLTASATLIEKYTDLTGLWQVSIGKDVAPGFYEFIDVRPLDVDPALGGYSISEDIRGLDITGTGFKPDILTATEAAYSAFSTATLRFIDTTNHAAISVGATQDYQVTAVCLPLIADIQAHVSSRDVRPYGGDCLVKAPVPCFLSLSFVINKRAGQDDPDVTSIKNAVSKCVNTLGFTGTVYASQLQDVIHSYLRDGQTVSSIDMHGRIRYPDGTISYLRDNELLQVPTDSENMVTPNTVQFYAAAESISIAVITKIPTSL